MDNERVELEADIEKLHHTLEEDRNQWQYDCLVDSDDDSDDADDGDALYIDLDKHGSASASVASMSARSAGGRTTPSAQSNGSQATTETQSVSTEQDDEADVFREVGVVLEKLDSTSSLPATLESCLVINRTYQDVVREHIGRIELELAENREAQRRLEEEATESSIQQNTKKRFPFFMSLPYFKMRYGSTPKPNQDVISKRRNEEPDLDIRPDLPCKLPDKEDCRHLPQKRLLRNAVTEDALEKLLQPLLSRRELEEEKLEQAAEASEQWQEIRARIALIDLEIEEKKQTPQEQLLRSVDINRVDWMKIANLTFHGKRDWMACRRAWQHSISPQLNQEAMKPDEEQRLIDLIKETDGTNWVYIAQQLGTGRTAFQCLHYYQQHLNTEMLSRDWSKEEDDQLIRVVEKCHHYHFNWNKVSQYMEGRSALQCYKRFNKLDPRINKGFWTEAEDVKLMAAVQLLGTLNWGRVSELVPGRTREQCRERYLNSLDPTISGKPWSYEEDKKLMNLLQKYGPRCWVKMAKELPGRTDNQILQRHRRLEDWRKKTDWFKKQSEQDREMLQGNNLPTDIRQTAQEKNWQQFREKFAVFPDDYRKQQQDIEMGEVAAPRPPFMIGLANKAGSKIWERRFSLHKLIESHIDKLKEQYNFTNPSVSGVFELQDAISQLSQDCINQRDHLMNLRKNSLNQLMGKLPSSLNVKDLLSVSRGGTVHVRKHRGPITKKRNIGKPGTATPRLHKAMKIDSELRKVVRANLKDRSLKKGRPRRFFWDISGDQKLSHEDKLELKATALSLYLKSFGADLQKLLLSGRSEYPELFHKLQTQRFATADEDEDDEQPEPAKERQQKRRSQRQAKREETGKSQNSDPFSLSEQGPDTPGFAEWQKQRDYELLEWLAKMQGIEVNCIPGDLTLDEEIPTASSLEVRTFPRGTETQHSSVEVDVDQPVIGHGMKLVHASIQQAMEESETLKNREQPEHIANGDDLHDVTCAGGDAQNVVTKTADSSQSISRLSEDSNDSSVTTQHSVAFSPGAKGDHSHQRTTSTMTDVDPNQRPKTDFRRQLPNLPPTSTSLHSFKHLLLTRLKLIKKAGKYYNLPYYLKKKDQQLAQLIRAGNVVQNLNKGTIDLSRMMNRVSQETDQISSTKMNKEQHSLDSQAFDFRVLNSLRKTEEYQLLQARFQALYVWPALLSAIYPPFQRNDYCDKAGGSSVIPRADPDHPNVVMKKRRYALLKPRSFYRYANKSKKEKAAIGKKRKEKRILKQVQRLMADEDDPNPEVMLHPDSDDDDDVNSHEAASKDSSKQADTYSDRSSVPQSTSTDTTEGGKEAGKTKKRRKKYKTRFPWSEPVRQSSRSVDRKSYTDRINQQRTFGPRKPRRLLKIGTTESEQEDQTSSEPPHPRLPRSVRQALINAMLNMNKGSTQRRKESENWNPGGYVSDEDADDLIREMQSSSNWVVDLPPEQQENLALLERESIVDQGKIPSSVGTEELQPVGYFGNVAPGISQENRPLPLEVNKDITVQTSATATASHSVLLAEPRVVVAVAGSELHPHSSSVERSSLEKSVQLLSGSAKSPAEQHLGTNGSCSSQPIVLDSDDDDDPTVADLLAVKRPKLQ